jgi:hypothetical protein
MEKVNDDIVMKVRSSRACIGAGYRLFTGNFKRIFRYSWAAALIYAVICSTAGTLMILRPQSIAISVVIVVIAEALFAAYGFAILKQHQQTAAISWTPKWFNIDTHIFIRTLKAWLNQLVIFIAVAVVIGGIGYVAFRYLSPYTGFGLITIVSLLVVCLLLPLLYIVTRYILTDGIGFWRQFAVGYPIAMRRWGFIFIITLVAILVELAISVFTAMPATILSLANMRATYSLMLGDPSGMPSYIGWLAAATYLLIGFIQAYVQLSILFPIYYMYGAIDAQEQERQDFNKNQQ